MPELKKIKDAGKNAISKYQPFLDMVKNIETSYKDLNPKKFGRQVAEVYEELRKNGTDKQIKLVSQKLQESDFGLFIRNVTLENDFYARALMLSMGLYQRDEYLLVVGTDFNTVIFSQSRTYNTSSKSNTDFGMAISAMSLYLAAGVYVAVGQMGLLQPEWFDLLGRFDLPKKDLLKIKRAGDIKDIDAEPVDRQGWQAVRRMQGVSRDIIQKLMEQGEEGGKVLKWVDDFSNSLSESWYAKSLGWYGMPEDGIRAAMNVYASETAKWAATHEGLT